MSYLENRYIFGKQAVRLAALYGLNYNDVLMALSIIANKYRVNHVKQAMQIFVELYNNKKG